MDLGRKENYCWPKKNMKLCDLLQLVAFSCKVILYFVNFVYMMFDCRIILLYVKIS